MVDQDMDKIENESSPGVPFTLKGMLVKEVDVVDLEKYIEQTGPLEFEKVQYAYSFHVQRNVRAQDNMIIYSLTIKLHLTQKEFPKLDDNIMVASISCSFGFEIPDLMGHVSEVEGKKVLDEQLHLTMVSVAYSTMRGIIWCSLAGTHLQNHVLPVVHPKVILGMTV